MTMSGGTATGFSTLSVDSQVESSDRDSHMTLDKLTIDDIEVSGRQVLVRVDFNVPVAGGLVSDSTRIEATLPTIRHLMENGGRLIIMSHLGRPRGIADPALSLRPVAEKFQEMLGSPVSFAGSCIGDEALEIASGLKDGEVMLLENLRFFQGEEANDSGFSESLAELGELYVNDAFGTAHRAHASTVGVTKYFDQCAAGYLMGRELEYLGNALEDPRHPFVAILGGAKISGKIDVIEALRTKVDHLLIGGGMAFTFLAAQGHETGESLVDEERIDMAHNLLAAAVAGEGAPIHLPVDVVIAKKLEPYAPSQVVSIDSIPGDMAGYDVGRATLEQWNSLIVKAETIVWNGPLGVFEVTPFDSATNELARVIAAATEAGAVSIIGGGDTAAAVAAIGLTDRMSQVSTGGGASLEFLECRYLPGVAALTDKK